MTLRATRQYAEVLAPGDGDLRVTRQYAEVLASGDGALRATRQYIEILSKVPKPGETDNKLELLSKVIEMVHYNDWWPTSNVLNLQQVLRGYPFEWGNNAISFTQVASGYTPFYRNLEHTIIFTDSARSRNHYHTIEDDLNLSSILPTLIEANANNVINFVHSADRLCYNIVDTITFNQSITTGKTKGIPVQKLELLSDVIFGGDWIRVITQTLGIGHSLTYYFDTGCIRKSYSPFIGESTASAINPPGVQLPFIQDSTKQFRLEYPALGMVEDTILLRAPELDNIDQNVTSRINRETRGGNLIIFADPTWPKVNIIKISFIGLLEAEAISLQDFIINHLGKDILLTDWEGREWIGIITEKDVISQTSDCNWSASFSFEGVVLDSCTPDTGLTLSDAAVFGGDWLRLSGTVIIFIDTAVFSGDWLRGPENTLNFVQDVVESVV